MTKFLPPLPDKSYRHSIVRRLYEAQTGGADAATKRLMAEAATELEADMPATDEFIARMRKGHAK